VPTVQYTSHRRVHVRSNDIHALQLMNLINHPLATGNILINIVVVFKGFLEARATSATCSLATLPVFKTTLILGRAGSGTVFYLDSLT